MGLQYWEFMRLQCWELMGGIAIGTMIGDFFPNRNLHNYITPDSL